MSKRLCLRIQLRRIPWLCVRVPVKFNPKRRASQRMTRSFLQAFCPIPELGSSQYLSRRRDARPRFCRFVSQFPQRCLQCANGGENVAIASKA